MRARRIVLLVAAVSALLGIGLDLNASATTHSPAVERSVSPAGEALYEYEALIHQMFGNSVSVCSGSGGCHSGWFYKGALSPLADYGTFTYAFSDFGQSTFHVMPATFTVPSGFGNYPVPMKINGRFVACSPSAKTFLISFGDAVGDGNLACLTPFSA